MTASDLETVYTALSQAVARAGPAHVPLLLSTLSLALLARLPDAAKALVLIEQAQRLTHEHPLRDPAAQADRAATPPAP